MTDIYRTYFRCKRCGERWSFDCNLYGYDEHCPKCGTLTTAKTWKCLGDSSIIVHDWGSGNG